ncbi:hypothetical protein Cgig2_000893 [Carnegiea gigantea]|uniref:Peroxidase n=1 Tax=Carnegiea gigantea TaxID=171969 RepID=A0A9Q1JNI1_9CARY|nr:hypothetical protein Cgig2_000893 [Carnegiea gigantea]
MRATCPPSKLALGLILMTLFGQSFGYWPTSCGLTVGFYNVKCGEQDIEEFIYNLVKKQYEEDPDTVSDLVRLTFHDCFVRGCDASVFLDGQDTEKTAVPNLTLGGLDTIDELKEAVEKACPGVVSCADLLMIAARSAVHIAGGDWFDVETGRRDGLVSLQSEALANIPPPTIPVPKAIEIFAERGLNKNDMVYLLGGHTVGTAHCQSFKESLYNFDGTNRPDPTISSALLRLLQQTCPQNSQVDNEAFLDQTPKSEFTFDNGYFKQIVAHNGTLEIDQQLAIHPETRGIVRGLAMSRFQFLKKFGPSMIKMGRIGVLTGYEGEIRKSCHARNNQATMPYSVMS